jgi:hypothetical protein
MMSAQVKEAERTAPQRLHAAQILTAIVLILAAVASAGGIFLPGLYRGNAWIINATRGQDVYTLAIAVPAMAITLLALRRGSVRALLVMTGITGYMLYTYIGGAFSFAFNAFFPIYVALYSVSIFALVALVGSLNLPHLDRKFDAAVPRRAVAAFVIFMGLMVALMEVGQITPFYTTGTLPLPIRQAEATTFYPLALDLGLIAPLCVLAGIGLWRRLPWGYLLTSCMLIKAATMGLALLATNWYGWIMGSTPDAAPWLAVYSLIGFGSLGMAVWFFRHCRP